MDKSDEKKVIICFSNMSPYKMWQRPQQLANILAQKYKVFFIYPVSKKEFVKIEKGSSKIKINHFVKILTFYKKNLILKIIAKSINSVRLFFLNMWFRIRGYQVIVWIHHIDFIQYLNFFNKDLLIYDCIDDIEGFDNSTKKQIEMEKQLSKEADVVFTTSKELYNKKIKYNKNCYIVGNGADIDHFKKVIFEKYDRPKDLINIQKPIVMFVGAIYEWIDLGLIEYLSKSRKNYNFVLIGPSFRKAELNKIIARQKNFFWLGEKKYQALPQYIYFADVCIVPFKINPLTIAADPIKTYEYLSTGKPIVSTDLPEVKKIAPKPIIYLANNKQTFLEYIDLTINTRSSKEIINSRLNIALKNSWQAKSEQIENIISQFFNKKKQSL